MSNTKQYWRKMRNAYLHGDRPIPKFSVGEVVIVSVPGFDLDGKQGRIVHVFDNRGKSAASYGVIVTGEEAIGSMAFEENELRYAE